MYGLAVAGDVRNAAVVIVLHALICLVCFRRLMLWFHFWHFPSIVRNVRRFLKRHLPPVFVVLCNAMNGFNSQESVTAFAAFAKSEQ